MRFPFFFFIEDPLCNKVKILFIKVKGDDLVSKHICAVKCVIADVHRVEAESKMCVTLKKWPIILCAKVFPNIQNSNGFMKGIQHSLPMVWGLISLLRYAGQAINSRPHTQFSFPMTNSLISSNTFLMHYWSWILYGPTSF